MYVYRSSNETSYFLRKHKCSQTNQKSISLQKLELVLILLITDTTDRVIYYVCDVSITTVTYNAGIDFIFILIKNFLFKTNRLTEKIDLEINEICKPFKIQALYKSPAFLKFCYFSCLNWIRNGCGKIEKNIIFIL